MDSLDKSEDDSITYWVWSGHGLNGGYAGVGTQGYSMTAVNLTPVMVAAIQAKLGDGAIIEICSCECDLNGASMQELADRLGVTITATTGLVKGGNGQGDGHDVDERIGDLAEARVGQAGEMLVDPSREVVRHGRVGSESFGVSVAILR